MRAASYALRALSGLAANVALHPEFLALRSLIPALLCATEWDSPAADDAAAAAMAIASRLCLTRRLQSRLLRCGLLWAAIPLMLRYECASLLLPCRCGLLIAFRFYSASLLPRSAPWAGTDGRNAICPLFQAHCRYLAQLLHGKFVWVYAGTTATAAPAADPATARSLRRAHFQRRCSLAAAAAVVRGSIYSCNRGRCSCKT